mmetsp:Transcript_121054/g.258482  ORF Transcript_121054/g.258482 Transcript_121054/m.258482 type:complete len:233 (+) Transcript_121054:92-790(+)
MSRVVVPPKEFWPKAALGEEVQVSGVRRRPEFNGAVGTIVDDSVDEAGRVTVRMTSTSEGGDASESAAAREMKIQLSRLRPLRETLSLPSLEPTSVVGSNAPSMASRSLPPHSATLPARELDEPFEAAGSAVAMSAVSRASRSSSLPALDFQQRKLRFASKLEKFKLAQKSNARADSVCGIKWHKPRGGTDVTAFSDDFMKCTGGVPLHKAYAKEAIVLRHPKLGTPCPEWK